MTILRRALVLPGLVAVLTLAGCPTPAIDMHVPGAPSTVESSHPDPPVR